MVTGCVRLHVRARMTPRLAGWGMALCVAASPAAWAEACGAPALEAEAGAEQSRWSEFDASGRRLAHETGRLGTLTFGLVGDCGDWRWQSRWQHAAGQRDYRGGSNNGASLQTTTGIRRERLQLQAMRSWHAPYALGAEWRWTQLHRDIADAGAVRGYPERFRAWQAAVGGRYTWPDVGSVRVDLEAWLGAGPAGHVDVALPMVDAARLRFGASRSARVGMSLSSPDATMNAPGWRWQLRLDLQQERSSAGLPQLIYRHGSLVGTASQPSVRQSSASLAAAVAYRF
ncbi:MAG: hypothetical protein JWQ88_3388 [Rhodoferax sp.]|nr:hypothetical protein [Rhodoferax sp.]